MVDGVHVERGWCVGPKIHALRSRPQVQRDLKIARSLGRTLEQFDALPELERDLWIEDWRVEQATCPDHGVPFEECADPEQPWYAYRRVDYAAMELEAAQFAYEEKHKDLEWHDGTFQSWSKVRTAEFPYRFDMGVRVGVARTNLAPWDEFTTKVDASPVPPSRPPSEVLAPSVSAGDGEQQDHGPDVDSALGGEDHAEHEG